WQPWLALEVCGGLGRQACGVLREHDHAPALECAVDVDVHALVRLRRVVAPFRLELGEYRVEDVAVAQLVQVAVGGRAGVGGHQVAAGDEAPRLHESSSLGSSLTGGGGSSSQVS